MKSLFVAPAAAGDSTSGAGTADDPVRVPDARAFDQLLRTHRQDTLFQLLPGAYETRGAWAFPEHDFCQLGDGCGLIGLEGPDATALRLAEDYETQVATAAGPRPAQKVEMVIAGSRRGSAQALHIEGLTLDTRGGLHANGSTLPTVALHVFANHTTLRRLIVLGVDGKWEGANEGFGILVNNCGDTRPRPGGHTIEDCRVDCLAGAYVTGLYCGVTHPVEDNPPSPSAVLRCAVNAPWAAAGRHAHAAFAANAQTSFSDCSASGFDRFFFCDTGSVSDILLERCRGEFGYCVVDLPGPVGPDNPIRYRRDFLVRDSTFTATNPRSDHVVLLNAQDGSPGNSSFPIRNLKFDGCTVVSENPGVKFYVVSVKAAQASAVQVVQCTLPPNFLRGVWEPTPKSAVGIA